MASQEFLAGLKRKDRKIWTTFRQGDQVDVIALRVHIESVLMTRNGPRSCLTRIAHGLIRELERYATAFDQLMQAQPDLVAAGWGVLRFAINVSDPNVGFRSHNNTAPRLCDASNIPKPGITLRCVRRSYENTRLHPLSLSMPLSGSWAIWEPSKRKQPTWRTKKPSSL